MRFSHFCCAAMLALIMALPGCSDDSAQSTLAAEAIAQQNAGKLSAATAVNASADALKRGDVMQLLELSLPKADFAALRTRFEEMRKKPISSEERLQFNDSFSKLTASDAVDKVMQEIEPKLAQYKAMLPGYIAMAAGALQVQIAGSTLSDAEKASANKAVRAIQDWAAKTDFADPVRARKAITALVETAKSLELNKPEDVSALSFEQMVGKMGLCLNGFKKALRAYDFDVDAILASVKATDVNDKGTVLIKFSLFGSEIASTVTLRQRDGRWSN